MRRLLVLALLLGCRPKPEATIAKDETPAVDAAAVEPAAPTARIVFHRKVVDLPSGKVLHELGAPGLAEEAADATSAFVLEPGKRLAAYDLASGKERWSVATGARVLAMGTLAVHVADGADVVAFAKSNGTAKRFVSASKAPIEELHALVDRLVVRHDDGTIAVLDASTGALLATHHVSALVERNLIVPASRDAFCTVEGGGSPFDLACHEASGKLRFKRRVELAKPGDPPGARFWMTQAGPHHVVFASSSWIGVTTRRAAVVRLSDGVEVARVEDRVVATAEREDGTLVGLIVVEPELRFFDVAGKVRWTRKVTYAYGDAARAVVQGDRVIVAVHSPIATGVSVFASALATGDPLWTGQVDLPPISHSKYRNRVDLWLRGGLAFVHGRESGIDHLHVFDATTGARRFYDALATW